MRQRDINRICGEDTDEIDHTLRGQSMLRATSGQLPRTLTAHEWEHWYAEHGVPQEHKADLTDAKQTKWWKLWR